MTKKEFFKGLTAYFTSKGFYCKSKHFYKKVNEDMVLVFGTQISNYGQYCYFSYGFCINEINTHLPYPKYNHLNLNCGRIRTSINSFEYEKIDEDTFNELVEKIDEIISKMETLVGSGRDKFIRYFLSGKHDDFWYILGEETSHFFGIPASEFSNHLFFDI